MSKIISDWIHRRLGITITPEQFAGKTFNGYLLANIIANYGIITLDQLNLIIDTDNTNESFENFNLLKTWLNNLLDIVLDDDNLYEIVHGIGSVSLYLFYLVYLCLNDKSRLGELLEIDSYVTDCNTEKKPKKIGLNQFVRHKRDLCVPSLDGGDAYLWYKNRMENLRNSCKKSKGPCEFKHRACNEPDVCVCFPTSASSKPISPLEYYPQIVEDSRTYEEILSLDRTIKELKPIIPDSNAAEKYIKTLKIKKKRKQESKLLGNQTVSELVKEFERKLNNKDAILSDKAITQMLMQQSNYGKMIAMKIAQNEMQKAVILENRHLQQEQLNKLKEKRFIETLILKDKELNEKKLTYYFERERLAELHRKIWNEKQRIKAQKKLEICSKTLNDIADISVQIAEYEKINKKELSRQEMEQLRNAFIAHQSTRDYVQPISRIIRKSSTDDIPEEILLNETDRQDAMDQVELEKYIFYHRPWELKNIAVTEEMLDDISRSLNILGHIVHQLLAVKYPLPAMPEKPDLPQMTIKVCVVNFTDLSSLPKLRRLLVPRGIQIIQIQEAIDYCIEAFLKESEREYKYEFEDPEEKKKKDKPKPERLSKGSKSKSKATSSLKDEKLEPPEETKINKTVQTPLVYPCQEIPYSRQADLGKAAQELLTSSKPLTDFHLITMFVEYLKSLPNLKGWVLINFPWNIHQVVLLEEVFTGVHMLEKYNVRCKNIADIVEIPDNHPGIFSKEECRLNEKRQSYLLPNPMKSSETYDSFLTAYIKLKKSSPVSENGNQGNISLPCTYEELGLESDPVDRFYSEAGLHYSMYYESFDVPTIKYLGKLVIGDYSLPLKSSVELFGDIDIEADTERGMTATSTKRGEKTKPKLKAKKDLPSAKNEEKITEKIKGNKEVKEKEKKKDAKIVVVREDKSVQVPETEELEEDTLSKAQIPPKAGQTGWDYYMTPFREDLMIALASLWEAVEEIYINDLKQLCFLKRVSINSLMPFIQHSKEIIQMAINQPDYNANYLSKFQKAFNAFDCDFRKDDEFKGEMFYRIDDFKSKLLQTCNEKMTVAENERTKLIESNWCAKEICEMTNHFINMMEIELERTLQSIRLIDYFYMAVFTNNSAENKVAEAESFQKISQLDNSIVNGKLQNRDSESDLGYFENYFDNFIQKANTTINKNLTISTNNLRNIESQIDVGIESRSKTPSVKSKSSKASATIPITTDLSPNIQETLIAEWKCAIYGESIRATMRFNLLKFHALQTIEEMLSQMMNCFHELYDSIQSKHKSVIESVQHACDVFHWAVEKECRLQNELIFIGDKFYINPEVKLFENPPAIPELPQEIVTEGIFTIEQLSKLLRVLQDLSPTGYISIMNFNFILQDFISNDINAGVNQSAPPLWKRLDSLSLKSVVNDLFDDIGYIYWRDFFVYNFRIPFPNETELLVMRRRFRTYDRSATEFVNCLQFSNIQLWFETALNNDLPRLQGVKQLLYKMYSIPDGRLNYTALLLDFCKDQNPFMGFVKALELSLGKMICWENKTGNAFVEQHMKNLKEHEESVRQRDLERQKYFDQILGELNRLVDQIVHRCDGVIIEDYNEVIEEKISDERQKKIESMENTESRTVKSRSSLIPKILNDLMDRVGNEPSLYTQMAFFLPIDVLISVITAALPWHSKFQNSDDLTFCEQVERIHKKYQCQLFNKTVLIHEFLNSEEFKELLMKTKKFSALDSIKVVRKVLNEG